MSLTRTGSTSVQSAIDWILQNPDAEPSENPTETGSSTANVPQENSGQNEENDRIGGTDSLPVEPAVERTPEEKAEAEKALQNRLDKARNGLSMITYHFYILCFL